jgi:hypothetical protein
MERFKRRIVREEFHTEFRKQYQLWPVGEVRVDNQLWYRPMCEGAGSKRAFEIEIQTIRHS